MSSSRFAAAARKAASTSKTNVNKTKLESLNKMLEKVKGGQLLTPKQLENYERIREGALGTIRGNKQSRGADMSLTVKDFNAQYPTVTKLRKEISSNVADKLKARKRKSPNADARNQEGDPLEMENLSEDEFAEMMGLVNRKSAASKERGGNMYNELNYNKGGVKRKEPAAKKKMMRGGAVKGKPRTGHSDYRKGGLFK